MLLKIYTMYKLSISSNNCNMAKVDTLMAMILNKSSFVLGSIEKNNVKFLSNEYDQ